MLNFVHTIPSARPHRLTPQVQGLIALWYGRWSSRRQLARMDDRMLRDIGLGPRQQVREARKPFWRP